MLGSLRVRKAKMTDLDQWHPTKPVIASVATSGAIYLWQTTYPDYWAAFAPGFEELEENVEYDEREDEFDIVSLISPSTLGSVLIHFYRRTRTSSRDGKI